MIDTIIIVMFFFITVYIVIVGFISSWFLFRMRSVIREYRGASDLLGEMVSSIYESINHKEGRIIDLMYRMSLLETSVSRGVVRQPEARIIKSDVRSDVIRNVTKNVPDVVSRPERILIGFLIDGPLRVPEITRLMGKSREHTSRMLSKLVRNGLLERQNSVAGITYGLTGAGRELVM